MPALGFGTLIPVAAETITATRDALEAGFRHFDCAERYRNERLIIGGSASAGGDGFHANGQSGVYSTALLNFLTSWGGIDGASLPDMVSIHAYPARTDVAPVPFPTTNVSNVSAFCTSSNVPNVHCRVPSYKQISTVKSSTVLQNSGIASWASNLPVVSTEGMWGLTANVCNGSTCAASDAGVVFLARHMCRNG